MLASSPSPQWELRARDSFLLSHIIRRIEWNNRFSNRSSSSKQRDLRQEERDSKEIKERE